MIIHHIIYHIIYNLLVDDDKLMKLRTALGDLDDNLTNDLTDNR